jgi:hypothetical protein
MSGGGSLLLAPLLGQQGENYRVRIAAAGGEPTPNTQIPKQFVVEDFSVSFNTALSAEDAVAGVIESSLVHPHSFTV